MSNRGIEAWAWVLLYGGLLLAALGWFVRPALVAGGTMLMGAGAALTVGGVVLIWWRSRRRGAKE